MALGNRGGCGGKCEELFLYRYRVGLPGELPENKGVDCNKPPAASGPKAAKFPQNSSEGKHAGLPTVAGLLQKAV